MAELLGYALLLVIGWLVGVATCEHQVRESRNLMSKTDWNLKKIKETTERARSYFDDAMAEWDEIVEVRNLMLRLATVMGDLINSGVVDEVPDRGKRVDLVNELHETYRELSRMRLDHKRGINAS